MAGTTSPSGGVTRLKKQQQTQEIYDIFSMEPAGSASGWPHDVTHTSALKFQAHITLQSTT